MYKIKFLMVWDLKLRYNFMEGAIVQTTGIAITCIDPCVTSLRFAVCSTVLTKKTKNGTNK